MLPALALLALAQAGSPVDRSSLKVPPAHVFEQMLRYAGAGDADKLRRSVAFLEPLLVEHREILADSTPAEAAFEAPADAPELVRRVQRLVLRDIVVLLRRIPSVNPDQARTRARTAALEWRLVEAAVASADRRAALEVEGRLRDVMRAVEAEDPEAAGGQLPVLEGRLLALFAAGGAGPP